MQTFSDHLVFQNLAGPQGAHTRHDPAYWNFRVNRELIDRLNFRVRLDGISRLVD